MRHHQLALAGVAGGANAAEHAVWGPDSHTVRAAELFGHLEILSACPALTRFRGVVTYGL